MTNPRATLDEDVSDQVDGITSSFTLSTGPFITGSLRVFLNGQKLRATPQGVNGPDYTETGNTGFELCFVPRVDDSIETMFEIEDTGAGISLVIASGRIC